MTENTRVPRPADRRSLLAIEVHEKMLLVDGHCDVPYRLWRQGAELIEDRPDAQVTLQKLVDSGVGCSFFVVYVPTHFAKRKGASIAAARELFDLIDEQTSRYDELVKVTDTFGIRAARKEGRIGVIIGVEGGHIIEDSLEVLRELYDRGGRYLTLTHTKHTNWADSSTMEPRHNGLTSFGREVVREMNRLGMLVDISHVSDQTFDDALDESKAPVIASHSSCRTLAPHVRNMSDRMLRDLAANRGICMINFFSAFVEPEAARRISNAPSPGGSDSESRDEDAHWREYCSWYEGLGAPRGSVDDVVDHIVHACSIAGVEHVGIGTDYDGAAAFPADLATIDRLPRVTERLLERSFSENEIRLIYGENFMRVFSAVEKAAE